MPAAGDIVATYGLDDKGFMRGLKGTEQAAGASVKKTEGILARAGESMSKSFTGLGNVGAQTFAAIGAAGGIAGKLMRDFAGESDAARGAMESLDRATQSMRRNIAMDLSASGGANIFADIVNWAEKARQAVVTTVAADFMGSSRGELAEVDRALRIEKEQKREQRFRDEGLKAAGRYAEAGGDKGTKGLIDAELKFREEAVRINGLELDGSQKSDLHAQNRLAHERERARIFKEIAEDAAKEAETKRKAAETAERELRTAAEKRVDERRSIEDAEKAWEIGNKRAAGLDKEADILETRAKAEEDRRKIADSELGAGEKAARTAALDRHEAERIASIESGEKKKGRDTTETNTLQAGFAGHTAQALGVGGSSSPQVVETKKSNVILVQIREAIKGIKVGGATFE